MKKTKTKESMVRINSRVRGYQAKFIKVQAKRQNITEGDVLRAILDMHIESVKI